jgi:hypothetical protein
MKIPAILDFSYFPFKKGIYKKGTEEFQALKEMSQSEDWALYIIEMKAKGIAINSMRLTEASKADDQFVVNNLQSDEKDIDTGTLCENEENSHDEEQEVEELGKFHDKPADMLEEGTEKEEFLREDLEIASNEELVEILANEFDIDVYENKEINPDNNEELIDLILEEQDRNNGTGEYSDEGKLDESHMAGDIQKEVMKAKDENPGLKPEEINKKNTQAPEQKEAVDFETGKFEEKVPMKEDKQPENALQDFKGFDDVKPGDKAQCYEKLGWTVLAKGTKQDWNDLKQHDSGVMQGVIDGASEDEDFEMIAVEDPERGKAVFVYGNEGAVVPTISDSEETEEENPQEAPAFNDHEVQENNPELPIDDENPIGDTLNGETAAVTDDNKPKLLDETMAPEIQKAAADAKKANPNASPEEINKINTSIKEAISMKDNKDNKGIIKEDNADDKRIQSAFVVFANAKKALEQAQTEITINLGYHFTTLFQAPLTQLNDTIESARKQIEVIAKEARAKLKR